MNYKEQNAERLTQICKSILAEEVDTDDIIWLQDHKQEVLETNDTILCQWAGITEEEYNNGKLGE